MADQGQGMLSANPWNYAYNGGYSYGNALPQIAATSPATGVASMADALINGYFNPNKSSANSAASSLPSYLTLPGLIGGLFGGSASMPSPAWPTTNASPSAGGLY